MNSLRSIAAFCAASLLCAASYAQEPKPVDGSAADPEAQRRTFKVADGFEVNLFASDPQIVKPLQMHFDAQGRLWVSSSETYPQLKPGEVPNDKVFLLEDTDHDGKADKSTIFAEGLFMPTGVAFGDGGVYAANSTEMVHLSDTNNDGKADTKRVVLAGFGTEDTHHILHTFRWGPDGRLYMAQSIYIHSQVETPFGIKKLDAGGVWRLNPKTHELDVYHTGLINGWGFAWDKFGQEFATDGAGGEGINYVVPGCAFTASAGAQRVLKGLNPGSPKYCGLEILSGRHIPDEYQGTLMTCDFRANRVVTYKLEEQGAGFGSKLMPNFITSTDKAFRPIDVKMGPDGAIYIADWYNPIINHGEVDFRDARRDKTHGRIWRVTAKGRPLVEKPKIAGAAVEEALNLLTAPEGYTRERAKGELRSIGAKEVAPALAKWVKGLKKIDDKNVDVEQARLEALWTYQQIDTIEPKLLAELLKSGNPNVRAAAARVASQWAKLLENPAELIAPLVTDENPRVRMEAVRAMAAIPQPESVTTALRVLDKPMDPFLDYAAYKTVIDLQDVWLPAFKAGKLTTWADSKHVTFALQAVKSPDAVKTIVNQLKSGQTAPDARRDVFELIGSIGSDVDVAMLLDIGLHAKDLSPAERVTALSAVDRAARQRKIRPASIPTAELAGLITADDPATAGVAARLAGALKLENARTALTEALSNPKLSATVGVPAAEALAALPKGREALDELAGPAGATAMRAYAIAGLATLDVNHAADLAAQSFRALPAGPTTQDRPGLLVGPFLKRAGGAEALAKALTGKQMSPDVAKLSLRYLQGIGQDQPALSEVFRKAAGLGEAGKPPSPEELKALVADVGAKGDAARGEKVFRSQAAQCYTCHMIGGAGGPLAPDLRSVGAASPVDYLVESILAPNKAIKDGYDSVIVATKDGDVIQGIKVREDAKELVLRDNLRDEIVIAADSVKSKKAGGSLMPAGLADNLTRDELIDLVRFMSELGKPGAYAVPNTPIVRRWRVLDPIPTTLISNPKATPPAGDAGWMPAYSMASGLLPIESVVAEGKAVGFVRCEVEVAAPGPINVQVNSAKGLTLWVDEQPAALTESGATISLTKGIHRLTFRVNPADRGTEPLKVELADAPGSAGRAQPMGGR